MTAPSSAPDPPAPGTTGTRAWTLESREGSLDVEVTAADDSRVGDVLTVLHRDLGLPAVTLFSGPASIGPDTPLSVAALEHGAVLGVDRPGPGGRSGAGVPSGGALELHVIGGPDAGRVLPLGQGELVVGRGAGCSLALSDPGVSRRHVVIGVGDGQVTATDLGSANGSLLQTPTGTTPLGTAVTAWPVGAVLTAGSTAVRLTGPRGTPLDRRPAPAGREQLQPLRAPAAPAPEVAVAFPAPPVARPGRRLGWVAVAVPAVAGLLMAWLLSTPTFLFFALLSPVVAIGTWLSDRIAGRRDGRRSTADHRAATAEAEARLAAAVGAAGTALDDAHPDPATLVAAVHRRSSPLWSRPGAAGGGLTVRLGLGPGPTTVIRVDPDGRRTPVTAERLPVTVDLASTAGLGIVGPRAPVAGVARSLLLQLTALLPPADLRVVVAAAPERLADWQWAAWLPHTVGVVPCNGDGPPDATLVEALSGPPAAGTRPVTAGPPARLLVLDADLPAEPGTVLTAGEGLLCVVVAPSEGRLPVSPAACLTVTGETGVRGRLRQSGASADRELTLDAVPQVVAAAAARSLAPLTVPAAAGGVPDSCRLVDLPGGLAVHETSGTAVGVWSRSREHLRCVLGADERGTVALDLCAAGPHALVAGTTGSGKSELLQTLVASLALHQPPDRVAFLLVDYKGGAAFAEAASLPHTVGLLTDLDPQSTARALRSLTAELSRRERVLAAHGVRDVAELPEGIPLPRLVIVVDEFATLAEELPGFVSGLVGIAQRGRSLGVHLVLATQRPSGVVSPEIRANCSLRICLRTTDEADSRDVLGTPLAAFLPMSRPGRAFLRAGSSAPVRLQVARVAGAPGAGPQGGIRVRRRDRPPSPPPAGPAVGPGAPSGAGSRSGDLARVVAALRRRAAEDRTEVAARPWLPPLPTTLRAADLDGVVGPDDPDSQLRLGLLDSPDTQSQDPLVLDLADGGGWLVVGGPRSGRTTALRTVLREAVHQLRPDRVEVHVLDHGGGGLAAEACRLPHTGTTVDRTDPHRSERLVARLQAAVDQRRSGAAADRHLLLLVDGVESLTAQLDEADPGGGSAALLRLVRDGGAAGLTCVLTADRAVPGSRLAAAARTRLVLPLPDRADYAVAGVPPRAVPAARPPGRALVGEDAVECQLVLPREVREPRTGGVGGAGRPSVSVVELPADPVAELVAATDSGGLWLPVGPGGDEGSTVGLDLARSGGLLVVGPPLSGRTCALEAFARQCRYAGARVLRLPGGPGSPSGPPQEGERLAVDDGPALRAWAARHPGRPAVVVADDVTAISDELADTLTALARSGAALQVLAAGSAADLAGVFRGPALALRRARTALLLCPAGGDAQLLLGLRLPRAPLPARPGSGWLVVAGAATRVQVARHRVGAEGRAGAR